MKGRFGVWYLRLCQWLARHRLWRPGKIMYIGGSDVLPAPLSREEEGEIIARLAEGDQAASSTLIEDNLHRADQGGGHLSAGQEHQAGHLCLPVHRE